MCGINGFVKYSSSSKEQVLTDLAKMNDLILHRGPDDDGSFVEINKDFELAMGMRRLSIIDLASGKQPITTESELFTIVFNGEIYNYQELRKKLVKEGINFKTHSDTEVILKLYELEGTKSFRKLDGMFAFSIYDKQAKKIVIARDFFGEKPLYYYFNNDIFLWASELKSLSNQLNFKPELSKIGLNQFFRLTYIPAPNTIYKDIYKLEANHYIEFDIVTKSYTIEQIEEEFEIHQDKVDFESAKANVRKLVQESVTSRSVADVPIGTFLSGGVDSSITSLCLAQSTDRPINTFSIGFEKKDWGETDKSRLVAQQIKSDHHEFIIGESDLKDHIHEILLNFDEPFSDTASLPTFLVAKKTSQYVKVALTGDGGDEIFGGYTKYYMGKINSQYTSMVPKALHSQVLKYIYPLLADKHDNRGLKFRLRKLLNSIDYEGNHYWDIISLANSQHNLKSFLNEDWQYDEIFKRYQERLSIWKPNSLTEYRLIDKIVSLEGGMLAKVDRTSMLSSIECRAPFLNKELWRYTNSLPEKFLMKGWNKKYILKEAFKEDFPPGFLDKSKKGFGSPVGDWLRSGLQAELETYISTPFLQKQGIFKINNIQQLVTSHLDATSDNTFSVWAYYCFQKWYTNIYESL
ncbi:asparagine synthase (glutamine-hydrolyzing) [Zeaxanthinibacter sp. PT1]|uniref:asparagine synthase (glutamine-hydrolyzing) n=1 Tax=Zeaxanthinibacter TaxID=561554 RepID=UPI00234A0EDE|nr:asparagine synthase (glutamine-hydrolyzing) [Zeaxanthinibacter sp. PT1]MDC6352772.1 asparagine synthase (glutamine-hydrolyzing) [Zeaxanthinibacter sp. PT1]